MPQISFAPGVFDDLERITAYIEASGSGDAPARIEAMIKTIELLADHPLMGRQVAGGKRELVIGPARRGYVALYSYLEPIGTVLILAIRSQREVGFKR